MPLFSGEPLPVAPKEADAERSAFHRKLLDYLRRLTSKLDAFANREPDIPPPATNVAAYAGFLINDQQTESLYTAINWEGTLWRDSPYEPQGDKLKVLEPGLYVFNIDLWLLDPGGIDAQITLGITNGDLFFYPTFGFGGFAQHSFSMTVPLPLLANTSVAVLLKTNIPDPQGLKHNGTRMTVLRVRDNADGGDGGGGIGWDGPPGDIPTWGKTEL